MIKYVFFSRDIVMEKHWASAIPRSICDYFFDVQKSASRPEDVPPVIPVPHNYLINLLRNNLFFVAVISSEGDFESTYVCYIATLNQYCPSSIYLSLSLGTDSSVSSRH